MTKAFVLEWHIPVDKPLLEGDTFDRWSEEEVEEGCRFKVDQDGFFISWKSEGREAEVLDLSQVTRSRHLQSWCPCVHLFMRFQVFYWWSFGSCQYYHTYTRWLFI